MGKIYYRDHEFSTPLANIVDVQIDNTSIVDHQIASIPILTGTDGNSNGAAGLVPQPTTTDRNKFLKSDGTWAIPSGGGSGGTADYEELANLPSINSHQLLGNSTFAQLGLGDYVTNLVLNLFYPVGSYYETSDTAFDPNTYFGGTWVLETEGLVHIGAGANYTAGDTGGSADAIIPYHNHSVSAVTNGITGGSHTHKQQGWNGLKSASSGTAKEVRSRYIISGDSQETGNIIASTHTHNLPAHNTDYAGTSGNAVGANMQPYIVVNRWHRTA